VTFTLFICLIIDFFNNSCQLHSILGAKSNTVALDSDFMEMSVLSREEEQPWLTLFMLAAPFGRYLSQKSLKIERGMPAISHNAVHT
jgi:hypothetical protein